MKLTYAQALDALNSSRSITASDVLAAALKRAVWTAEWHAPGCMPEAQAYCATKMDAIEVAMLYLSDSDGEPRGALTELRKWGRTDIVCPTAYVRDAITTVTRTTLGALL
jgi:hypothetical protein